MAKMFEWQGDGLCRGTTRGGNPCTNPEIDGLEHCIHHVPDDMLDEAEDITGTRRCRHNFGLPDACRYIAVSNTDPPTCKVHGANLGSETSKQAARRGIENDALDQLQRIMSDDAMAAKIMDPDPITNPLESLLELASEIRALTRLLRNRVMSMKPAEWRYSGRAGEQVRAELLLWERAQERQASILIQIAKLRINEKMVAIEQGQQLVIEKALNLALQASDASLEGQQKARLTLVRELKAAAG